MIDKIDLQSKIEAIAVSLEASGYGELIILGKDNCVLDGKSLTAGGCAELIAKYIELES